MQDVNFTWPQGEDMTIELRYKEGPTPAKSLPVNLSGYSASMALVNPGSPQTPLVTLGTVTGEIVLSEGVPNIVIRLARALTNTPLTPGAYSYDLFIRNDNMGSGGTAVKIMEGTINVRRSITPQWP